MGRLKKKITAVLLIIAFTQKLGLGLFIHAWFHENSFGLTNDPKNTGTHIQQVRCTCIEDAMIPYAGAKASIIISSPVKYFFNYCNPFRVLFSSAKKIYYSLRGPPSACDFL
ncbi:MAG TPA: hypothetical protein VK711_09215 [Puia sp.]|nr:hypothetical protein [Puia sp.]